MRFSFVTQNIYGDKIAFPEVPWNANIWKLKSNVCIWFVICHLIHVLNAKSFARMPASWISKLHEQSNVKTDSSLGNNKREKCHSASYPCMVPVSYSDFIKYYWGQNLQWRNCVFLYENTLKQHTVVWLACSGRLTNVLLTFLLTILSYWPHSLELVNIGPYHQGVPGCLSLTGDSSLLLHRLYSCLALHFDIEAS